MKKMTKLLALGGVAMVAASLMPTQAICASSRLIANEFQYIYTGDVGCPTGYPCQTFNGNSVSPNFKGTFWVVTAGDPAAGVGSDSGTFPARLQNPYGYYYAADPSQTGWVTNYAGYPPYLDRSWASSQEIDGCPDITAAPGTPGLCTAMVLTDEVDGQSYFALLAVENDAIGNYNFAQPSGEIRLQPLDRAAGVPGVSAGGPVIAGSTRLGSTGVELQINAPMLGGDNVNIDGACGNVVTGYKVFTQVLPRGSVPPSSRDSSAGWVEAGGANSGETATVQVDCSAGDSDIYVTTSLTLDSGFETPVVSANSQKVDCGTNSANPGDIQQRPRIRPGAPIQIDRSKKGGRSK